MLISFFQQLVCFTMFGLGIEKKLKKNYIEIFIDADINKLISKKKKTFYLKKSRNIVGKNILQNFQKKT